ncbi:hypothetical protein KC19_2G184900 [Ceratodon purpureus]|uniref:Leucine-rich repeat-containing N-terminal plant-type domain-containing protein n=1 Tax=Ceratodon purpureus TaxID=3225 RepID=A0A8T0IYF3_CERPU|nr:hypothetical protein KC19_2G184900 [Ceratodon purpureus]
MSQCLQVMKLLVFKFTRIGWNVALYIFDVTVHDCLHDWYVQRIQTLTTVAMEKRLRSWSSCTHILVSLAVILAAATRCNAATCTSNTVDALIEFRRAFIDPRNRVFSSWDEASGNDCCTWAGVTCQNGALVVLDLEGPSVTSSDRVTNNHSYSGRPGHTLNKLQDLQTLKLKNLEFNSRIPSQWSSFPESLVAITINNCDLQGSIPSGIASNSKLQTLDLKSNNLTGEIPSRLCNLQDLKYLDLSYNDLDTSSVPSCITNGGSITNVNYGHQNSNSDNDVYGSGIYGPDNGSSGTTVAQPIPMMILLLLPLFSLLHSV